MQEVKEGEQKKKKDVLKQILWQTTDSMRAQKPYTYRPQKQDETKQKSR